MTASQTPEQSARTILGIFKSQNCIAGDPLEIGHIKTQFLENHGSESDYTAGLLYAEDNGWLEVTPRDGGSRERRWTCGTTYTTQHAHTNSRWLCRNVSHLG